jgi:cation-transporting ATPase 13A1
MSSTPPQVPPTVTTIQDGLIDHITLYRPVAWFQRLDVFPFLIVYLLSIFVITTDYENLKFPFLIVFPIGLSLHLLLFLFAQSSVDFRCILGKKKVKDITQAVYVHVHAAKNAGKDRMVPLMFLPPVKGATTSVNLFGEEYGISPVIFSFQEVTYCYNIPKATFFRLNYPVKSVDGEKFVKWQGHTTQENVIAAYRRWGINEFNIPMPHFLDLYMEHLVAPFFVFQVLCLFLWSLDDYWYYSAFTLIMLMFFEGVMCNQRLNSVAMMRNMRRPPYKIFVYRCGSWSFVDSDNILPGDILSITADQTIYASDITESGLLRQRKPESNFEGKVLPCDILLIKGNCVVNEAMLTGESIPKVKESFNSEDNDIETMKTDDITRKSIWNRHILLGGTLIQQHSNPFEYSNNLCKIPHAPDYGCIGIAIRTGFATTQGELMRKILFATEGTSGASKDTFAFIAVLVLFALVAAGAVLQQGIQDERRNKFRLALHCIMIITSVVPPELPMELSLAVSLISTSSHSYLLL